MPVTIGRPRLLIVRGPAGSRGLPGGSSGTSLPPPTGVPSTIVLPFTYTQDSVNPRLLTIPGTDSWIPESLRVFLRGQRLLVPSVAGASPSNAFVVSGAGNRTVTLDVTVDIDLGDAVYGEGIKAAP